MDLRFGETSVALNEAISVILCLDLVYKMIPEVAKILKTLSFKSTTFLSELAIQIIGLFFPIA